VDGETAFAAFAAKVRSVALVLDLKADLKADSKSA
jgi:hypothetical protein